MSKSLLRNKREGILSNSSSRAQSASRTPMADSDDEDGDYEENDLLRIEEILREKLSNLHQQEMGEVAKEDRISAGDRRQHEAHILNNKRIQENSNIKDIITSLTFSRTDISSQSRELLLAQLYKTIVSKPLVIYNEENAGNRNNYVDEEVVLKLINQFTSGNYRSEIEFLYMYRSLIALLCSDIEEFGNLISNDLTSHIEHLITEPTNSIVTAENKASVIQGFTALSLILYHGSSTFGVDDRINMLMDVAEGYSASATTLQREVDTGDREHATFITDKNLDKRLVNEATAKVVAEASVAVAALQGVACLLTLMKKGEYANEIQEDLMLKLVPLLDNDENRDIARAAGRAIGVIYELYDYSKAEKDSEEFGDNDDPDYNVNSPYYEQESLKSILSRLLNLSSKKVSKKDKKDVSSVFRSILNTVELYTDKDKREQVYKGSPEGIELANSISDSSFIKLSKYKLLRINSWYLAVRLRQLKWCFSFGLHSQLVANDSIRDVLQEPENEYSYGSNVGRANIEDMLYDDHQALNEYMDQKHATDEKSRNERRKKERLAKLDDQLEQLELGT
ncbi:conserved hypothetical protein [Lodderomyces elongisporus NRRL YB-4239]|uniref:Interferon-related developmental regulator N-terminal domain-containing protein n=1 Tax=Lodderomyces elongisporus (strain ATCC 11503 / CBS 2605 / JCM 1781 / NBRC 1676 / NRRL YB-4239) TaxID=379508 RepID=A5DTC0_LODEL|nr:conserved hypothetical protein [Lodderomyces elongisporus NRRL YB-4239]